MGGRGWEDLVARLLQSGAIKACWEQGGAGRQGSTGLPELQQAHSVAGRPASTFLPCSMAATPHSDGALRARGGSGLAQALSKQ